MDKFLSVYKSKPSSQSSQDAAASTTPKKTKSSGTKRKRDETPQKNTLTSWVQKLRNREFKPSPKKQKTESQLIVIQNEGLEEITTQLVEYDVADISSISTASSSGSQSQNPRRSQHHSAHSLQNTATSVTEEAATASNSQEKTQEVIIDESAAEDTSVYVDMWDADHVRFPCSPKNTYRSSEQNLSKWYLISTILEQTLSSPLDIEEAILSYNQSFSSSWNFDSLKDFLMNHMERLEYDKFFELTLPRMQRMALDLPKLVTRPIKLLKQRKNATVKLTQEQIASLMCNAFFCTFPRRNTAYSKTDEYYTYPSINFNHLFRRTAPGKTGADNGCAKVIANKLKALINYFEQVTTEKFDPASWQAGAASSSSAAVENPNKRVIEFERRYLPETKCPDWTKSNSTFCGLKMVLDGALEDCKDAAHLDFANKKIGGGVLGKGCVQEEIRFLICPECIVSRLFTEEMLDSECLLIRNSRRFSNYSGYADKFEYTGTVEREKMRDFVVNEIICIDAVDFSFSVDSQYQGAKIRRELNKAYIGFVKCPRIATGNWGGGVFQGDRQLKALIQLMAASEAKCTEMLYYAYGDTALATDFEGMHQVLSAMGTTTSEIIDKLMKFKARRDEYNVLAKKQKQKVEASTAQGTGEASDATTSNSVLDKKYDVFYHIINSFYE